MSKNRTTFLIAIILSLVFHKANAQSESFQLLIEPHQVDSLQGLQAYAFGTYEGKWILIGGRLDGLHRRQPFASFDAAGTNTSIFVVDPINRRQWKRSLNELPQGMKEQLSSTNMQFCENDSHLYLIGGYGYSQTKGDHMTYPKLTAVNVGKVIDAIVRGLPIGTYFRQITDTAFAVTGGYLNRIYDRYYLSGGHRFDGRYNPMNNPTFVQTYTNSVKVFDIEDDGSVLQIKHIEKMTDNLAFHRRDYNVLPQIMPNGEEGLTLFSGVFREDADLPYLNCVNIDSSGYEINNAFSQYYNHYHCAHIPLYSKNEKSMHNLFFGGMSQYHDSSGVLVKDDNVPFVNTIARVTRDSNGLMKEYLLPLTMPGLLGSSAEFIFDKNIPLMDNGVVDIDEWQTDTLLMGYIYGGINSSAPNIFWINNGTQSSAWNSILKVSLVKNKTGIDHVLNVQSSNGLKFQVDPNPNTGVFNMFIYINKGSNAKITIYNSKGQELESINLGFLTQGEHKFGIQNESLRTAGVYYIKLEDDNGSIIQKIVVEP